MNAPPNEHQLPRSFSDRPCFCGAGRIASPNYICITCARFVGIKKKIAERAPYLYAERRSA